jgi:hypothetical protein
LPNWQPQANGLLKKVCQHRSHLKSILNVAHLENTLSWQLGWAGENGYASGAFIGYGLACGMARLGASGLGE